MKLFKFYSTSENYKNPEALIDIEGQTLNAIQTYYDNGESSYIVKINSNKSDITELHEDINFARKRIEAILIAFNEKEEIAKELAMDMKFVIR